MSARQFWTFCAAAVATGIAAKAFGEEAQLQIDFSWAQTQRCTSESPKIHVSNVPNGTVRFEVVLQDLDVPTYHHGGGTVVANPKGDIPAGVLPTIRLAYLSVHC